MKTIVITGASSGIGMATARHFAEKGWRVAATMRDPRPDHELSGVTGVKLYRLDVTDLASILSALDAIIADFGSVDVVLNNAGYGLAGPFESVSEAQIAAQFETNLFGLMRVTRAFLTHFRQRGHGLFMNVSSIGGRMATPFLGLYQSTKWAMEGFSESLAMELKPLGIAVKIIEPGAVRTDFTHRSLVLGELGELPDYQKAFEYYLSMLKAMIEAGSKPEFLAEGIYAAATDGEDRLRYLVGPDAELFYARRVEIGEDAFMAEIGQMFQQDADQAE